MALETIEVGSLKSSLNSCKESINYSISSQLKSSIMNSDVWNCDARNNLESALKKLEGLYEGLKSKLDSYLSVAGQIEAYQVLYKKNIQLKTDYDNLSKVLYKEVEEEESYYDDVKKEECTRKVTVKKLDSEVDSKMKSILVEINQNVEKMKIIESSINSSI